MSTSISKLPYYIGPLIKKYPFILKQTRPYAAVSLALTCIAKAYLIMDLKHSCK